jgi:uncharacterized protein
MDITTTLAAGVALVSAYGQGGFTIAGEHYTGSVLFYNGTVTPINIYSGTGITSAVLLEVLATLIAPLPEIVLVGTGAHHEFIAPEIRSDVKARYALAIDSMDTGAACRTFNVLASEGRRVAVLLVAV